MALSPWPARTAVASLAAAIAELGAALGEADDTVTARLGATSAGSTARVMTKECFFIDPPKELHPFRDPELAGEPPERLLFFSRAGNNDAHTLRLDVLHRLQQQAHPLQRMKAGDREDDIVVGLGAIVAPRRRRIEHFTGDLSPLHQSLLNGLGLSEESRDVTSE